MTDSPDRPDVARLGDTERALRGALEAITFEVEAEIIRPLVPIEAREHWSRVANAARAALARAEGEPPIHDGSVAAPAPGEENNDGLMTRAEVRDLPATALLRATLGDVGKALINTGESPLFSLATPGDCQRLAEILGPFLVDDRPAPAGAGS